MKDAKIFLTDYASYNNGTQFEFGHWVTLSDFSDAEDLKEYIKDHFREADLKSPLDSPREEVMITDYENIPSFLYSESGMQFEIIYSLIDFLESEGIESLENEGDNLLYLWNEYCSENCPDDVILHFDNDNIEMLIGTNPLDIFNAGRTSQINYSDDYLYINGYGYICSIYNPSNMIDETLLIDWIIKTKI